MTIASRQRGDYVSKLDAHECRAVLAAGTIGRIGWAAGSGQLILPVTYGYRDPIIGFRTHPNGRLSELVRPTPVAFEVDILDQLHNEGVSVLIQGVTRSAQEPGPHDQDWTELVVPWAGGQRELAIEISISRISGRRIHRDPAGLSPHHSRN